MPHFESPYEDTGTWLRGNLHAHTTVSDGACDPDVVVADYGARGYDFLAISDHDALVDPSGYRDRTNVTLLPAVEVSANGPHVLHVGATRAVTPAEDRQAVLDDVDEGGGIAIACHPNWEEDFDHWAHDALVGLDGYVGIEIYNAAIERHPGAALATDRWDRLLSAGRRVWGYANDDAHRPCEIGSAWNVVRVDERTPAAIGEALATGLFYASTGVTVVDVEADDGRVAIETVDAERIRLVSDHGVVQQTVQGSRATFRVPDQLVHGSDHSYVRVECDGLGGTMAWTQPVFLA